MNKNVPENVPKNIQGLSLLDTVILMGVLGVGAAMMSSPLKNLQTTQKSLNQRLDFDRKVAEISDQLAEPIRCTQSIQVLPGKNSTPKCGTQGANTVAEVGVQILGSSQETLASKTGVTPAQGRPSLNARIKDCAPDPLNPNTTRSTLEISLPRTDSFTLSRTLRLTLRYGSDGTLLDCVAQGLTTDPAKAICEGALGGTWDSTKTSPCTSSVTAAAWTSLAPLIDPPNFYGECNRQCELTG